MAELTIYFTEADTVRVTIYNTAGRVVKRCIIEPIENSNQASICLNDIDYGVYMIKLNYLNGSCIDMLRIEK